MRGRIVSFLVSIIFFITLLFGIGAKIPEKSIQYRDIAYGTHERQTLDLNIPTDNDGEIGLEADEENRKTATELFYGYCETYLN